MRLHYFQHIPFEGLGYISQWAEHNGFDLTHTAFFDTPVVPEIDGVDWLVVMGGPMGVYDDRKYRWLLEEKKYIEKAISCDKVVVGICLGAQLIADVLGAKIRKNDEKEIGWYPVNIENRSVFEGFERKIYSFHWHGDTFDLPEGARRIASSEGCLNQAFSYNRDKVVGLQFHMEIKKEGILSLLDNCADEIVSGRYIQTTEKMLDCDQYLSENNKNMSRMLSKILETKKH